MPVLPINKRPFRSFLSHAHADKDFADRLHSWLTDFADIRVWYDSIEFPSGAVASELGNAIERCQSAVLILTEKSIRSGWVEQEWNICVEQKNAFPDFQIVMLNLDNCVPPAALRVRKWIAVDRNDLNPTVACQVLEGLHWHATVPAEISRSTFYLSRGSRPEEVTSSERSLTAWRQSGYRFVRDAPDQFTFEERRVKSIIASTSGLVAFVPHRGGGKTSKYILDEIRYAREINIPAFVVVEDGVSQEIVDGLLGPDVVVLGETKSDEAEISYRLQDFFEEVRPPRRSSHCFVGHGLGSEQKSYWQMVKRVVEAVCGLPCVSGDDIVGDNAQNQIVEKINQSAISIFDISDDRLNTCIEAGIARGAGVRYELTCRGPRRRPPFIFRDKQVFFYENETELLGLVRRLVFDLRRVVS